MSRRWFGFVAGLSIGLLYSAGCTSLPQAARQELLHSSRWYEAGDLARVETATSRIITRHPNADEIGEAYYLRGLARVRRGRTAEAKADLRQALQRSRRKDLSARAATALAMTLQQEGAYAEAADYYERALAAQEAGQLRAETLYHLAVCRQRAGQWPTARRVFERLIREHPASPHAGQAGRHAAWPHSYFAVQCGVFSNRANAGRLLEQLGAQGLDAYLEAHSSSPSGSTVVRVGHFADYAAAQRTLPQVRGTVPDAYIVP